MIKSKKEDYWKARASKYSRFTWANDEGYLSTFIGAANLKKTDFVLDLGCGPGIVSRAAQPHVGRLIGMDNSKDMLNECDGDFNFLFGDAEDIPFPDNTFNKILARNIFHHMTSNVLEGARESLRVLDRGGQIIVGERIPPSENLLKEWKSMLALKDERICFSTHTLFRLLDSVGFKIIHSFPFTIIGISLLGWLYNTGLDEKTKEEILDRHINGSQEFKEGLNLRTVEISRRGRTRSGGWFIDVKNIIMVAEKI